MGTLNFLDILALAIIMVSVTTAVIKGLMVELLSLGSVLGAFYLSVFFYAQGATLFSMLGLSPPFSDFVAFAAIFVMAVLGGLVLIWIAEKAVRKLRLKLPDRLLGGLFGLVRGWLIASVLFLAFTAFAVGKNLVVESYFADFFLRSARLIISMTPEDFEKKFYSGYEKLSKLKIELD